MKSIRHIGLTALVTVGIFSVVTYTSCKKDSPAANAAYVGSYNTVESCNIPSGGTFSNVITASSSSSNTIVITNFGDSGETIDGTVSGNNVTLTPTTFSSTNGSITVTGSGTLNGSILTITYSVAGGSSFTCTDVMTKQ